MPATRIQVERLVAIGVVATGLICAAVSHERANVSLLPETLQSNKQAPEARARTLYDADPNHLWNRLYRALYRRVMPDGREAGYDELDPLLWWQTKYLLNEPANQEAVAALDEFLTHHAERKINDPLRRAILQRDLWAIFDWTTEIQEESPAKVNLQNKLAEVIRRLALPRDEIARLPDSYPEAIAAKVFPSTYDSGNRTQPFLPPDLFDPKGPWVMLSARGGQAVAFDHTNFASGRSTFLIFIRLPGGRAATLAYLKSVLDFSKPWLPNPNYPGGVIPNPQLPEFPAGTQLALVRKANLIDSEGSLQTTNIIEDLQIRVHRKIPTEIPDALNLSRHEAREAFDGFEFKFNRLKLLARESGGLRAVTVGEKEFALFHSHGIDFEQRESLALCASCHFRPGVHSMLSRGRVELGRQQRVEVVPSWDLNYEAESAKGWKGRQYSWGLLQGLWRSQSAP